MASKQRIVSADFLLVYLYLPLSILNHEPNSEAQGLLIQGFSAASL